MIRFNVFVAIVTSIMLTGCAGIQSSMAILNFQKAQNSGITSGQEYLVFMLPPQPEINKEDKGEYVAPWSEAVKDTDFSELITKTCQGVPPPIQPDIQELIPGTGAVLGVLVTSVVSYVQEQFKSKLKSRAEEIAKGSQKISTIRIVAENGVAWNRAKCIIIVRNTELKNSNGELIRTRGFAALLERDSFGQLFEKASRIRPVFAELDNSIAITDQSKNDKPASVKINVGITISSLVHNRQGVPQIAELGKANVAIMDLKLTKGDQKNPTYYCGTKADPKPCKSDWSKVLPPLPHTSPSMVEINIVETGTSANAVDLSDAANKALDGIVKPTLDELVKQLVDDF